MKIRWIHTQICHYLQESVDIFSRIRTSRKDLVTSGMPFNNIHHACLTLALKELSSISGIFFGGVSFKKVYFPILYIVIGIKGLVTHIYIVTIVGKDNIFYFIIK